MSVVVYTKLSLIQRIRKHMSNGYPKDSYAASDREIMLYVDEAAAFNMVGQVYQNAKVEGNLVMPEAYLTTYLLPALTQDNVTSDWYTTLPQPPVNLPLGYSITQLYFANSTYGKSQNIYPIRAKRVSYRENLPMPAGARYWVENSKVWIAANEGSSLLGQTVYCQLAKTRTDDINEEMNLPDDAIEFIFNNVVAKLIQRYQQPKDIVRDDLPASNTNIGK